MANHALPVTTSTYANYTLELKSRMDDLALGVDPAVVTATNLPTNTIGWTSAGKKWQKWNGTVWGDLATSYTININGTVGATTPSTGAFTTLTTSGTATITGSISASNLSGNNTGDQTTVSGNAGSVTNGVYTNTAQTILGIKTFTGTSLNLTGNLGTYHTSLYIGNRHLRNVVADNNWEFRNAANTGNALLVTDAGVITATSFNSITGIDSIAPLIAGTASAGTSTIVSRRDHVHPIQTTVPGTSQNVTGIVAPTNGGTGVTTLSGVVFGNGTGAFSAATPAQIVAAISTTPVANATTATTSEACSGNASNVTGVVSLLNGGTGATTAEGARAAIGAITSAEVFASGTRMPFAQASAPIGWTQDTTDSANNRMLRVVTTAGGGIGGTLSPIVNSVVPSHTHGFSTGTVSSDHSHSGTSSAAGAASGNIYGGNGGDFGGFRAADGVFSIASGLSNRPQGTGGGGPTYYTATMSIGNHTHTLTTGGISANHTHSGSTDNGSSQTNWTPRYIDMIICTKN